MSSSTNDEVEKETPKTLISTLGNEENSQHEFDEERESNPNDYESEENFRSICTKNPSSKFSEQEEIILLKSLKKFRRKHGPKNDWVQFHKFMECKLSTKFTKGQISEKIRRLEMKFKKNTSENRNKSFHGHEARLLELSESLWGKNVDNSNSSISNKRGKRALSNADFETETHQEERDHVLKKKSKEDIKKDHHINPKDYPHLSNYLNHISRPERLEQNWSLIGIKSARKLEQQWEQIFKKELVLTDEKMGFVNKVYRLILKQTTDN